MKTLELYRMGMDFNPALFERDKEVCRHSDLPCFRVTTDDYSLPTWDGKRIYAGFSLWEPNKEQRKYLGMSKNDPKYIICGEFAYNAEDGLTHRWMTKTQRINPRVTAQGEFYSFTKAGLLAYVNECIAAEPYDEIVIKSLANA